MKQMGKRWALVAIVATLSLISINRAAAQTCYTAAEMNTSDPTTPANSSTRTALENAARQDFQGAQMGGASLQSQSEFDVSDLISANKQLFSGQPTPRNTYLLDNSQPSGQSAEFLCGIYNSPDRVAFMFGGLPPGRYGIVIQDVTGKTPGMVTWIFHQAGTQWKIAGLYPKPSEIAGHDANWYLTQARAYKAKGQLYNAWFYFLLANDIMRPFPSMSTSQLDRLYDEMHKAQPPELPGKTPMTLTANGRTYNITSMFPYAVGDTLDLVAKYTVPDISDSTKTFQENTTFIKALVTKYPELREAFGGIVARATAPNGQDYGTPLAIKDVK